MANIDSKYWIWLQCALGEGVRTDNLSSVYSEAAEIYFCNDSDRRKSGIFTENQIERMKNVSLSDAEKIIDKCLVKNWKIITPGDGKYPKKLLDLKNFPLALYYVGELPDADSNFLISMVGARKASEYGTVVAEKLAGSLARSGAVVVSGGALGIDSVCHRATLRAGGKTVAVLGHGFGVRYLMENRPLWIAVSKNGAVVTEFRPGLPVGRYNFPLRNRIIAALSSGTVVVEASKNSGSLITAKLALDYGRDVFAIPGNVTSPELEGCNRLIRDGAKPVLCTTDILDEYKEKFKGKIILSDESSLSLTEYSYGNKDLSAERQHKIIPEKSERPKKKTQSKSKICAKAEAPGTLNDDEKRIYGVIGESPISVDEIIETTGVENKKVLVALTTLEMQGLIQCLAGRKYVAVMQN